MNAEVVPRRNESRCASFAGLRGAVVGLVLAALVLAVYRPVFHHDFLTLDDNEYVTGNPRVSAGLTVEGFRWSLTSREVANWHPLTWISHMLDVQLFGLSAGGHHAVNAALHLANALLLLVFLRSSTGLLWPSALVAALFAAHPLQVESVAWISERKTVLATLCWLLALVAYRRYLRSPAFRSFLPVAALLALGATAKPLVVTLPFALLLLDYWPFARLGGAPLTSGAAGPGRFAPTLVRLAVEKSPLFVLAGMSSAVTYLAQREGGAMHRFEVLTYATKAANALVSYRRYLGNIAWPWDLTFFYPYPRQPWPPWHVAGAALLLVLTTVALFRFRRRGPWALVGWLWFLGTLVPMIGLVQVGDQALADRYVYVPVIGLFMGIVWGCRELVPQRAVLRAGAVVLSLTAVISLAAAARLQVNSWGSDETLYGRGLAVDKANWVAAYNLGVRHEAAGRLASAEALFRETIRLRQHFDKAYNNLGGVLARTGRMDEAIELFRQAARLSPSATTLSNLGVALARRGDVREAEEAQRAALRLAPDNPVVHNNLGSLLLRLGRNAEALAEFERAIALAPGEETGYSHAGYACFLLGRLPQSLAYYRRALEINPGSSQLRSEMGMVLERLRGSSP